MKILFCIKALSVKGGGAERVMTDVANGLVEREHQVSILTFDKPNVHLFYPLDPRVEKIELGIGPTQKPSGFWVNLRRMVAMRRRIVPMKPDVVVGFMHSMFVPLGIAMVGSGIPVVASEHIVPVHYRTRPLEALLLRTVPWFVRCITCISDQVRDSYSSALAKKMVPMPNPVTIKPAGRADVVGQVGKRKTLLTVGRLEEQKDHETLIKAFAIIADKVPDWDLRIIGEGALHNKLTSLVDSLGLQGRVSMPGATNAIGDEYLAAQLFVLPSLYESFGLTTAEALAHSLPAIGFEDCQGTNLLIRPGENGELVPSGKDRHTNLAKGLLSLMTNDKLRRTYSERAADSIEKIHGLETVVNSWQRLLAGVIASPITQGYGTDIPHPTSTSVGSENKLGKMAVVLTSLALLIWVLFQNEVTQVVDKISDASGSTILICITFLFLNQLIAGFRFLVLLRLPITSTSLIQLNYANARSLFAGLLLFSAIGQGLSRSRFFYKEGAGTDGFSLTGLERLSSLLVLLTLAAFGAFFAFGKISFGQEFVHMATIGLGLGLVSLAIVWLFLRTNIIESLGISFSSDLLIGFAISMFISLLMHIAMAGAYLLLAFEITGSVPSIQVVGAIFVVMLAASVPISFNGWGIRELSAGAAFTMIGLDSGSGVAMSLMIGVLSIVALFLNLGVSALSQRWVSPDIDWSSRRSTVGNPRGLEVLFLGFATCALIGFFVRIPYGSTVVTANLADPFAILAGLSFAFHWSHTGRFQKVWRIEGLGKGLLVTLFVIVISFLIGVSRFGVTDWALINRLTGSLILIAYLLSGAGLAAFFHDNGIRQAGKVFVTALCVVVIMEVLIHQFNIPIFSEYYKYINSQNLVVYFDISGFTLNRNKFVFILLIAFIFLIVLMTNEGQKRRRGYELLAGLVACAIYLTHSRSGIATGLTLLALAGYFRWASVVRITFTGAACFGAVSLIPPLLDLMRKAGFGYTGVGRYKFLNSTSLMEQMQSDRLYSYAEGLKMWLDAPVFGAGLGAFINEQIISSGVPLVIHSTPLWLLVETGIVGFILIMSVPVVIMLHLWRHPVRKWCAQDRGIFLLLITLALMSILHELSYQRIFWLSLGMFAARYWTHQAPPKTDSER